MDKPKQYDLKAWLSNNTIVGLKIYYYQTGTDTADTDWEMESDSGKKKRVKASSVCGLVDYRNDWCAVFRLEPKYRDEV